LNKKVNLIPISTDEFPAKAPRPLNSKMSKAKVKKHFEINIPQWEDSLKNFLKSIKKNGQEYKKT
jgi:dTDP-4-dehydrorhamnose reductase